MNSRSLLPAGLIVGVLVLIGAIVLFTMDDDDDGDSADNGQAQVVSTPTGEPQTPPAGTPGALPTGEQPQPGAEEEVPTPTQPEPGDPAPAPEPPSADTFGYGTEADDDTIAAIDIDIPPSGEGLPEGSGTPEEGAEVYAAECAFCHGPTGAEGGIGPQLVSEPGPWQVGMPRTIGSWWPYATTVWDYTYRAMPFDQPGSLEPDQVYAVTAYLLEQNGIIGADEEMNAETLPQVQMPNQPTFIPCWPDGCVDEFGE